MGITGLWPILEPCCQPVTLESLEGKKLAVDVSIWIYQAQLGYSAETRNPHLALLISRLSKLLFYKIKPVFIFDGPNVPIFKKRVLEERRLKKFDEDILLNKGKRKQLEEFARGTQNEEEVPKKFSSHTKKRHREDEAVFDLPSISAIEEVTLSDDDAEIIVEKVIDNGVMSKTTEIDRLMDLREQIRESRLHPSMIPQDTEKFCQFQLARVLGRSKINRTIDKLTQEHQSRVVGGDVRLAVSDSSGGTHVISYDNDIQVVNPPETEESKRDDCWESLGLTLDHLRPSLPIFFENEKKLEDCEGADLADLAGRDFLGKSSMIEAFMKRRIGNDRQTASHEDEWSSSDSGDDDFIDVDDGIANEQLKVLEEKDPEPMEEEREWAPESPKNEEETRLEFLSQRHSDHERDSGAYRDLQSFLTACGFPWIEAPGEAEAQCVELERLGLVQGVVSDDSDVWAFGAQNVYRHLFSKNKNVQYYQQKVIFDRANLSQSNFVEIALLSGGDYSIGIRGVGIVGAIELLAEFTPVRRTDDRQEVISTISAVEKWLLSPPTGEPTATRRKLRAMVEKHNDSDFIQGISNPEVVDAYMSPNVDSSREPLRWRRIDIAQIRTLSREKLGWTDDKFDKTVLPSFQKWNDFVSGAAMYQKHMTSYTLSQSAGEQRTKMTKRVVDALGRLARKPNSELPSLICEATFEDEGTARKSRGRSAVTKARKRGGRPAKKKAPVESKLDLSESSDDD